MTLEQKRLWNDPTYNLNLAQLKKVSVIIDELSESTKDCMEERRHLRELCADILTAIKNNDLADGSDRTIFYIKDQLDEIQKGLSNTDSRLSKIESHLNIDAPAVYDELKHYFKSPKFDRIDLSDYFTDEKDEEDEEIDPETGLYFATKSNVNWDLLTKEQAKDYNPNGTIISHTPIAVYDTPLADHAVIDHINLIIGDGPIYLPVYISKFVFKTRDRVRSTDDGLVILKTSDDKWYRAVNYYSKGKERYGYINDAYCNLRGNY